MAPIARCRSCGALIVWVRINPGGALPLDAHEVRSGSTERSRMVAVPLEATDGNIVLEEEEARHVAPGAGRYRSHFSTCAALASPERAI